MLLDRAKNYMMQIALSSMKIECWIDFFLKMKVDMDIHQLFLEEMEVVIAHLAH